MLSGYSYHNLGTMSGSDPFQVLNSQPPALPDHFWWVGCLIAFAVVTIAILLATMFVLLPFVLMFLGVYVFLSRPLKEELNLNQGRPNIFDADFPLYDHPGSGFDLLRFYVVPDPATASDTRPDDADGTDPDSAADAAQD